MFSLVSIFQNLYDRERSFVAWEQSDIPHFLEGTGGLVLDRVNQIGYMALSQRANMQIAVHWAKKLSYKMVTFRATDVAGRPIYHTNVMMAVCCFLHSQANMHIDPTARTCTPAHMNTCTCALGHARTHTFTRVHTHTSTQRANIHNVIIQRHNIDTDTRIYLTRVFIQVGSTLAIVCLECVEDPEERQSVCLLAI